MTLDAASRLLLALLLVSLAACSKPDDAPGTSPGAPVQEAGLTPTQAELDRFIAEGPEPSLQALRPPDYWLHYRLMQATGVEEALGGEGQAVAALKALAEDYERQARGAQADVPRMIPVAFTGEGMTSGFLGLGMGTFGGLMTGGLISSTIADASDATLAELAKDGPMQLGGKEGGYKVTVGADGSIHQDIEFEGKVDDGLTGKVKVKMKMDACPDAQGRITVVSDVDSSVRVAAKAGTGGYVRSRFVYERWLDDDAQLMQGPEGSASRMDLRMGGYENYESQHLDISAGWKRGGSEVFENRLEQGFSIFRPDEVQRTKKLLEGAQLIQTLFAEMLLRGTGKQSPWESGRCIKLDATSTPGKRSGVKPSTSFEVTAAPRVKSDGSFPAGTVRATLTGGQSLTRDGEKVRADAQYTYVAPAEKDKTASIAFEARSKRGVGRATLEFDTRERRAYRITVFPGCGGVRGEDICDLSKPFAIEGTACAGGASSRMAFTPSGKAGGTMDWSTRIDSISAGFNGTYTVEETEDGALLHTTLTGCAMGPGAKACGGTGPDLPMEKVDTCPE